MKILSLLRRKTMVNPAAWINKHGTIISHQELKRKQEELKNKINVRWAFDEHWKDATPLYYAGQCPCCSEKESETNNLNLAHTEHP